MQVLNSHQQSHEEEEEEERGGKDATNNNKTSSRRIKFVFCFFWGYYVMFECGGKKM